MEGHAAVDTMTAHTTHQFRVSVLPVFNGWSAEVHDTPGDVINVVEGHYRTPEVRLGEIVWSEESRNPPTLSENSLIVFQYGPDEIIVWCPVEEWNEAATQLQQERLEAQDARYLSDTQQLQLQIKDPASGWLWWAGNFDGSHRIDTFKKLPDSLTDDMNVEVWDDDGECWIKATNEEALYIQLKGAPSR